MSELSEVRIVTEDGIVTATVLDEVSPERLVIYLFKGAYAAQLGRSDDNTDVISRGIKDLVLRPFEET